MEFLNYLLFALEETFSVLICRGTSIFFTFYVLSYKLHKIILSSFLLEIRGRNENNKPIFSL